MVLVMYSVSCVHLTVVPIECTVRVGDDLTGIAMDAIL